MVNVTWFFQPKICDSLAAQTWFKSQKFPMVMVSKMSHGLSAKICNLFKS